MVDGKICKTYHPLGDVELEKSRQNRERLNHDKEYPVDLKLEKGLAFGYKPRSKRSSYKRK